MSEWWLAAEGVGEGLNTEDGNVTDDNMTRCELLGAGRYEVLGTRSARIKQSRCIILFQLLL